MYMNKKTPVYTAILLRLVIDLNLYSLLISVNVANVKRGRSTETEALEMKHQHIAKCLAYLDFLSIEFFQENESRDVNFA